MHISQDTQPSSTSLAEAGRISLLLGELRAGDPSALGLVFEAAYPELHKIAQRRLRSKGQGSCEGLESAGLVHELFMRLAARRDLTAANRVEFFRYAATAMRSILVDGVRRSMALRRGAGLTERAVRADELAADGDDQLLRVHQALEVLADEDPELTEIVQMRFFMGLSDVEVCQILGISDRTVRRRWDKARALLSRALTD